MPKSYNGIYERIYDYGNLLAAYRKARAGKRFNKDALLFSRHLEEELIALQNELVWGTYRTGAYRLFYVYEPKKRQVAALPFRDRVVHHAICNIIEPLFERKFILDSYACRKGKGTHAASDRLVYFLRRAQRKWGGLYALKADISKYFPSINHTTLKGVLGKTVRCRRTIALLDEIIDSASGLPIGNLTSQLFANIYLNELDHFVKESLRVKFYVRYMDDFIILHPDKRQLRAWLGEIEFFLGATLQLTLNPKTGIFPAKQGVDFVGYRTWPTHRLLRKRSIVGVKRRLRWLASRYAAGKVSFDKIRASIASWLAHARHASCRNVVQRILGSVVFKKGLPID